MAANEITELTFFESPDDFAGWLEKHHDSRDELWVGFYKKDSGRPSITWPESVDEALCFGWIDGIRRKVDEISYAIRFTPRRPDSVWSKRNIERYEILEREGRIHPAGKASYSSRDDERSGIYSYEQRPERLPKDLEKPLRANKAAWKFYQSQPPWYRRAANWWIVSAKRDSTKRKRLAKLIEDSAAGRTIPPLTRNE